LLIKRTCVQISKASPNHPRRAKLFSRRLAGVQLDDAREKPSDIPCGLVLH